MLVLRGQCFLYAPLTQTNPSCEHGLRFMATGWMSPVSNGLVIPFHSSQLSPKGPGGSHLGGEVFVLSPVGVNTIVFILETVRIASGYRILKKYTSSLVIVRESSSTSRTLN